MKLHHFGEVSHEIGEAVVAGINVILVLYAFLLQLLVKGGCAFFEAVVVIPATVEIDGQPSQSGLVSARQSERTVLFPVRNFDRVSENRRQQLSQRSA